MTLQAIFQAMRIEIYKHMNISFHEITRVIIT